MEETGSSSEGRRPRRSGGGAKVAAVPGYLRPSAGSCHHVCKYGGAHNFEEREARRVAQPRPRRRQQQQQPAPEISQRTAAAVPLAMLRSASSRRRVGDLLKPDEKAGKPAVAIADAVKKDAGGAVVWKDIVAYESSPQPEKKITIASGGDGKKKDVTTKGKKKSSSGKAKIITEQTDDIAAGNKQPDGSLKKKKKKLFSSVGSKLTGKPSPPEPKAGEVATSPSDKKSRKMIKSKNSVKPPKPKKNLLEIQQEIVQEDDAAAASEINEEKSHHPLGQEEKSGRAPMAAAAHRRAKSMSITGSKSVRFPFTRQASRSSATFKVVRSKSSSRASSAAPPEEDQNPAPATRLRFIRRGDAAGGSSSRGGGGGIQLRIRSLRRRGSISGGTTAAAGFVVPAVALRHQKTLEKKRSRRLYNSVIEETAGKLVKARKSKVKALVGAFESLISKIGK